MNCTAPLASLMCNTLCIMQHALSTELITMLIPPSIWSCISALVFLTTNCSGVSRWHNDCGMSVTDGKNMLQMVWKWEVRLCHKEPQWSRPEGIQMASTWTPLTAQLDGEEVGGGEFSGLNRRQVCVHLRMYQSMSTKCSIHTYKWIAEGRWRTLAKPLTKE